MADMSMVSGDPLEWCTQRNKTAYFFCLELACLALFSFHIFYNKQRLSFLKC